MLIGNYLSEMNLIYDKLTDVTKMIYIFDGGLYARAFDNGFLKLVEGEKVKYKNIINNHFGLNSTSKNYPVFLAGKKTETTKLYDTAIGSKTHDISIRVTPGGYPDKLGGTRIFYFDKDGPSLWGIDFGSCELKPYF